MRSENIRSRRKTSENFENVTNCEGVPSSLKRRKGSFRKEVRMGKTPRLQNNPTGKPLRRFQAVG